MAWMASAALSVMASTRFTSFGCWAPPLGRSPQRAQYPWIEKQVFKEAPWACARVSAAISGITRQNDSLGNVPASPQARA
jgi:hypothetical protein